MRHISERAATELIRHFPKATAPKFSVCRSNGRPDRDRSLELLERAAQADYDTLMVTMDKAVGGARLRDARNRMTIPPSLTLKTGLDASHRPA